MQAALDGAARLTLWDLSPADQDPQGLPTLQGELESWEVLLCGDLGSDKSCCPGLCGCITSPGAFYLQPPWNHCDLNLLGVILSHPVLGTCWQVPVGADSRVTAQGRCVGFHYLTLLTLKEHT